MAKTKSTQKSLKDFASSVQTTIAGCNYCNYTTGYAVLLLDKKSKSIVIQNGEDEIIAFFYSWHQQNTLLSDSPLSNIERIADGLVASKKWKRYSISEEISESGHVLRKAVSIA